MLLERSVTCLIERTGHQYGLICMCVVEECVFEIVWMVYYL